MQKLSLFADWQGLLTLPPSPLRKETVGGNTIYQLAYRGGVTRAEVSASDLAEHYVVKTRLQYPFNEVC